MSKSAAMRSAGAIPLDANVRITHFDRYGRPKPIFQENGLCIRLLKAGLLSPHWISRWYGPALRPLLGYWATEKDGRNLITSAGKAAVASRINGAGSEAAFTSIGQGTGTTAATVNDTTLEAGKTASGTADSGVHALPSASVTVTRVTTTVTNDTAQMVGTVSQLATMSITESGLFNADTGGVMLARQTFTAIPVSSGDSLQFTWKIKAS